MAPGALPLLRASQIGGVESSGRDQDARAAGVVSIAAPFTPEPNGAHEQDNPWAGPRFPRSDNWVDTRGELLENEAIRTAPRRPSRAGG